MTTQAHSDAPAKKPRTVPIVILIVATLVAAISVIALWVKRQALETTTWVETSTELLEDKAIQDALADFIVNTIYENVDVQGEIASALPPRAQILAGPVAGGLRQVATRAAQQGLEQEKVQGLWEDANRVTHERLLALIEDEGEYVSTTGGQVSLDVSALVDDVAAGVGIGGDVASKLPAGAAEIEVLHSDELDAAQKGVKLLRTLAWFLTVLALVLYGLAIYFARGWRREMLRAVGFSFIAIGVIDLFARNAGGEAVVASLSEASTADTAVLHAWEIGTSLLKDTAESLIVYGIVMVAAAWLAGPSSIATSARHAITPYLRQPKYAYLGLAGILIILFWWNPVIATGRLLPSLALILVLAIGVEALRRQVIREFPDHVQTGSPEGMAHALADRMREARERR
ncbi:MAG: hypothetical protein M3Y40_04590, partial [Chloroflexota bacterium]|nr:hypothetical protein [Chloroflexota bacterium]